MNIEHTGVIILCRYNSTRLPGKILLEIEGKPILQHIVDRILEIVPNERILVGCSVEQHDDSIYDYCKNHEINCFRGSLKNVGERFFKAMKSRDWKYAVRINGDNIFLDSILLKEMIIRCEKNNFDFYSNVQDRTFPKGQSIEIVKSDFYEEHLKEINKSNYHSEHVMTYFYGINDNARIHYRKNTECPEAGGIQLAIDDDKDLAKAKYIFKNLPKSKQNYSLKNLLALNKKFMDEE